MIRRAIVAAVVMSLLAACHPRGVFGPVRGGSSTTIADGRVHGALVDTGAEGRVHGVVTQRGAMFVLASSDRDVSGDVLLRSDDGGMSWTRLTSPLPDAIEGAPSSDWTVAPASPDIHAAGRWLVVSRTVVEPSVPSWQAEPIGQAVAISDDDGSSWISVELPVPNGSVALVRDAAVVGDRLVLAGTVQGPMPPYVVGETTSDANYEARKAVWDAGVWWSDDPAAGFTRVGSSPFGARVEAQTVMHLDLFDGRLVATGGDTAAGIDLSCCATSYGPVSWETADGQVWSALNGLATPAKPLFSAFSPPPAVSAGRLVWTVADHRYALDPRSKAWRALGEPAGLPFSAARLRIDAHRVVVTWVEDAACDCSYAFAGVVDDAHTSGGRLEFDTCHDISVRGAMSIGAPHVLGNTVVAKATCNNEDRDAANLAWSSDTGATWQTQRLRPFAPAGRDLYVTYSFGDTEVWTDRAAVLLLNEGPADSEPDFDRFESLPIVALILTP